MKLFKHHQIGISAACVVLLAQLLIFLQIVDSDRLWKFLEGPITGWLQFTGSVAAIFASYKMGEQAFRKQVHKEDIDAVQSQIRSYKVLAEMFKTVSAVDELCISVVSFPYEKQIQASAKDALEMLSSVPAFEVPHPDLVRRLLLSRQAMISYTGWAVEWQTQQNSDKLHAWSEYAKGSQKLTEESITFCEHESLRLESRVAALKLKL